MNNTEAPQAHCLPSGFATRFGPWALIAGGSEGTGASFATLLASQGINLVLTARREAPLAELKSQLENDYRVKVITLAIDMTRSDAEQQIIAGCQGNDIGLFIYNLGSNVHYGRFTEWPRERLDYMVQMNCQMPMVLAHHFAQGMKQRGAGGIVFLGSMASMAGAAYMSIYPATKAYLQILAEGLWHDLKPYGIDVMCSILGATRTPSHEHMQFEAMSDDKNHSATTTTTTMECDDVALETLQQIGKQPIWVVGEHNRALLPEGFLESRAFLVEMMSLNTAQIAGLEHTPLSEDQI